VNCFLHLFFFFSLDICFLFAWPLLLLPTRSEMLTTDMQEHASLGACTEHEFVIVYCRCDIIHHDMVVAAHTTTHPDPLLLKNLGSSAP
jgi:hypothetical protein